MPTTIVGLFTLIVLALPGYVYQRTRARAIPKQSYSALSELLSVVFVGVAVDVTAIALMLLFGGLGIAPTPDVSQLVREPHSYFVDQFSLVVSWAGSTLLLAVVLAAVIGSRTWLHILPSGLRRRIAHRERHAVPQQSAWWLLFHEHPGSDIYVGCILDDGSYVAGYLHSYSRAGEDGPGRDLTLRGDIFYRAPRTSGDVLPDVNAVVISARHIALLTVTYVTESYRPPQRSPGLTDAGSAVAADVGLTKAQAGG